jgi:tRNA (mo5U34)-methyltransferase
VTKNELEKKVKELGPWYHRIDLGQGVFTKEQGLNPESKWRILSAQLPDDLSGKTVLEIGCSSAYYSVRMAERGATCYAFDHLEGAIRQAQFLASHFGVEINTQLASVYDLRKFRHRYYDYVIFLGVLYHNRYPMLVLDMIGELDFGQMFLQTITYEDESKGKEFTGYIADQKDAAFHTADFPTLKFVEHRIRNDATSWYNFNNSAVEAMMRASGMTNIKPIAREYWLCDKGVRPANGEIEYLDILRGVVDADTDFQAGEDYHSRFHDKFQSLENNLAKLQRENAELREKLKAKS